MTQAFALINFQGRLAKPDGTPVSDGTYSMQFSLYNAVTAGTQNWTQTVSGVTVRNGSFAVLLSGFPATTFNGALWLQIQIGTAAALTPRQQMVSVAYAMKANTVPDGNGTLLNALLFGLSNTGEGIASKRTAGGNQYGLDFYTMATNRMSITNGGYVGIGTNSPVATLDVNGIANVSGFVFAQAYYMTSDGRCKTHIATLNNALDSLLRLRGVSYAFDRAKRPQKNFVEEPQIGFIAQEIEQICPELVTTNKEGYKAVNYIGVVPILVESVKTQQQQIADKQRQLNVLHREIETLKAQNARLETRQTQFDALTKRVQQIEK